MRRLAIPLFRIWCALLLAVGASTHVAVFFADLSGFSIDIQLLFGLGVLSEYAIGRSLTAAARGSADGAIALPKPLRMAVVVYLVGFVVIFFCVNSEIGPQPAFLVAAGRKSGLFIQTASIALFGLVGLYRCRHAADIEKAGRHIAWPELQNASRPPI